MRASSRLIVLSTIILVILFEIRIGAATQEVIQPEFVSVTGPHGVTVLVGPLIKTPNGGYERVIIVNGQTPMTISTEPNVTPQEIANVYG
jgi:hypothetical protein